MTIIVAVFLLLVIVVFCALTWVLVGMVKGNGTLFIRTITAAIPPKIEFHIEYRPPDHPPAEPPKVPPSGGGPEVTGSGGDGVT